MKAPLSYVPAMPAALGLMAGIVLYYSFDSWLIVAGALVAALVSFIVKRHWLTFYALFVALGWLLSFIARPSYPPAESFGTRLIWSGEVTDTYTTESATRLTVDISFCQGAPNAHFKSAVLLPTPTDRFSPGDRVTFPAKLYNPDRTADLPDEVRFNPTFFVDGITAQANVSPDDITITSYRPSLKRTAAEWQTNIRDLIYGSPISSSTAWFLTATLIGDDSMLDPTLTQQFRATGAAHYLALSGFHIGIIAMLASAAFFPFKIWSRVGRLRHLIVIIVVWLYAFTCGMAPSLVRAAVLISVFLLAKVVQRQSSPYNSLCVAAVAILTFSPRQLFAPGFQMSFCAVLLILAFSNMLNPIKNRRSKLYRFASFATVPIAAMLGTCLISMFHFHRFPVLFLLPNLILAVLLPLLLSLGVILILSTALNLKLTFVGILADFIYEAIEKLCNFLSSFDSAEITGIFLHPSVIAAAAASIILLALSWHYRRRLLLILAATLLAIAVMIQCFQPAAPDIEMYITRQRTRTDIVIHDHNQILVSTTAPCSDHLMISRQLSKRYSNFMARRNCSDSLIVTSSNFSLSTAAKTDGYLVFDNKVFYIPTSAGRFFSKSIEVNYLVISRATGSKPFNFVKTIRPDTVIIARDVPPLRARKLIDSCNVAQIPYIHLLDRAFSYIPPTK